VGDTHTVVARCLDRATVLSGPGALADQSPWPSRDPATSVEHVAGSRRSSIVVGPATLDQIVAELDRSGYEVWVPTIRDGTVTTRRHREGDDLPVGYVSDQSPASYDLTRTEDRTRFAWAVGPQPWKPLLHPSDIATMTMLQTRSDVPVSVSVATRPTKRLALFGMRPCDLAAVDKLDRVLLDRAPTSEPTYQSRREGAFLVVVNCGVPASTCFCASVNTGPHVEGRSAGHDLEVTELVGGTATDEPSYVIESISDRGAEILAAVVEHAEATPVTGAVQADVESNRRSAEESMRRHLPDDRVAPALVAAHDSNRWDEVAEQCLACGNCTAVCPTCFCTTIDDIGDLSGTRVERHRRWESCFSLEFSRVGSSPVRSSLAARYRQWMTHKLGTWHDQFGESGCVGCGRCTTWCPAGIDFVRVAQGFVDDLEGGGS
jgi:sulfhydrogenase subunit beta (sulfur reductase)